MIRRGREYDDLDYAHKKNPIICAQDSPSMLPTAELIAFHLRYRCGERVSSHQSLDFLCAEDFQNSHRLSNECINSSRDCVLSSVTGGRLQYFYLPC
jgi:hypothetical protein